MSYVFQGGDRVRLAVEFVGNVWETEPGFVAGEGEGPHGKGDPVTFPAGSTGTISPSTRTSPPARYLVIMDGDRSTMLMVRPANLEWIPGRTRVISTGEDTFRIEQVFDFQDVVRLRRSVTTRDGITYEAGAKGGIIPMDLSMSDAQNMQRAWETGVYPVQLFRDNEWIYLPAFILQLDSDFRSVGRSASDHKQQEATGSGPGAVDAGSMRDLWAFVVAAGEDDQGAADEILAGGDRVKTMVQAAASHISAKLPEQGRGDPVSYGREMIETITAKEANDGGPSALTAGMRDLWALVVAVGEDDQGAADEILARGDHVKMLVQATAHIMGRLREQGRDPVSYGREMIETITKKEAKGES